MARGSRRESSASTASRPPSRRRQSRQRTPGTRHPARSARSGVGRLHVAPCPLPPRMQTPRMLHARRRVRPSA
eukprot:358299-Chlamydomonas_euryale.AAC.4